MTHACLHCGTPLPLEFEVDGIPDLCETCGEDYEVCREPIEYENVWPDSSEGW
jgi:hypothetical protein